MRKRYARGYCNYNNKINFYKFTASPPGALIPLPWTFSLKFSLQAPTVIPIIPIALPELTG
ncbi:hypothetical protein JCM15764A_00960 [Geotalea toluenoxydans]